MNTYEWQSFPYCGCEPSPYKEDCYFYGEMHDMGATIRYCSREEIKWGYCPCDKCDKYLSKTGATEIIRKHIEDKEKIYPILSDFMYDREYMKWVPSVWLCGCCHAKVKKTDNKCWHCLSKLEPVKENENHG